MSGQPRPFEFRRKLLQIFAAGLALFFLVLITSTWYFYEAQEQEMLRVPLQAIPERLRLVEQEESAQMESLLLAIASSERLLQLWKSRDRDALLREVQPLFETLRAQLQITHLYFTDIDRTVFLRVHHPARFGDRVERFTTEEAQRTGKRASGLELGPLGTLTLRVVLPIHREGRLAGFMELGKEFSALLEKLSRGMELQLFPFLDKKRLDPLRWQEGMRMLWHEGEWNRFAEVVHVGTAKGFPTGLGEYLASGRLREERVESTLHAGLSQRNDEVHFLAVPLEDVRRHQVGWLVGGQGHEVLRRILFTYSAGIFFSGLGIGAVLLGVFYRHLSRMEERMLAAHLLVAEAEESLAVAQGVARVGNWDWRVGKEIFLSREVRRILGLAPDAPLPKGLRAILEVVHPLDRRRLVHWLRVSLKGESPPMIEYRLQGRDAVPRHVQSTVRIFHDEGRVVRVVGVLHDVTEMRRMEESLHIATSTFDQAIQEQNQRFEQMNREKESLEALSLTDPLTGLGNRRFFEISLTKGIEYSRRREQPFALMMLDLDRFKPVNDTLGHEAGDLLLRIVADRLREQVRLSDQVYRIGGDEFAVLLPDPRDESQVLMVAERICAVLAQPFPIKGESCTVGCSVGCTLFPGHGETPDLLMNRADQALYWMKRHGRGRGCIFSPEMEQTHQPSVGYDRQGEE